MLIAQDMVLQLEAEGEEVALFTIFDTWVLENSQFRSLWAVDYYYQRIRALRSRSLNEQLSTMRRTVGRWIAPVPERAKRSEMAGEKPYGQVKNLSLRVFMHLYFCLSDLGSLTTAFVIRRWVGQIALWEVWKSPKSIADISRCSENRTCASWLKGWERACRTSHFARTRPHHYPPPAGI